jgi:hypothetical protein
MAFEEFITTVSKTRQILDFAGASPQAKKWWQQLELLNKDRPSLVARLADELCFRNASIDDFFLACSYSGREGVDENLYFLDTIYQDKTYREVPTKRLPRKTTVRRKRVEVAH